MMHDRLGKAGLDSWWCAGERRIAPECRHPISILKSAAHRDRASALHTPARLRGLLRRVDAGFFQVSQQEGE
jgi:hypothetical protein